MLLVVEEDKNTDDSNAVGHRRVGMDAEGRRGLFGKMIMVEMDTGRLQ